MILLIKVDDTITIKRATSPTERQRLDPGDRHRIAGDGEELAERIGLVRTASSRRPP